MEKRPNLTKTKLKLIWEAPKIKLLDEKVEAELKAVLEPFKQALKEKRRKQKEAEIFSQLSDLPPAAQVRGFAGRCSVLLILNFMQCITYAGYYDQS